jgi:hypothetical protein
MYLGDSAAADMYTAFDQSFLVCPMIYLYT